MMRHEPLRAAARIRLNQLISERTSLLQSDDAARRAASLGLSGASRYAVLRSAGLDEAAILAAEPTALNPEVIAERRRARIAEITPQIEKLKAFGASGTFDTVLLADFPEFIDLIAARDGQEGVKVCL